MAADITFVYENLAVGGGILTDANMKDIAEAGITHIIDAQAEYDDTPLAKPYGIKVLWCPTWDDLSDPDPAEFERAIQFVNESIMSDPNAKLLCHCAGGVHRGPMFTLLAAMWCGVRSKDAVEQIEGTRLIASFPYVYRNAVERFVAQKRNQGK